MHTMHRIGLSALALALGLALSGCGDKKEDTAAPQVAAKVNGDAISVPQINHELAKLGKLSPEQSKKATNQLLKSLVDQQLLLQKAIADKVEGDPEVVQALESARRQILVQAYIQKITASLPKPSDAEIADYYAKHPELFGERRIYRLQEITVQVTPANVDSVKAQLAQSKNLNDFIQWLKAQNIPARAGQSTKTAEQLPLEILPRLHQMKDGQAMTLAGPNSLNILVVAGSQTQPLTQEQAKPVIERFITNAKKREAAAAELKTLKEKAKIEYLGEYAEAGKDSTPAQPAIQAQPEASVPANGEQAVDKGLPGLK
jgi:EpsD family peptidyl-prolyl cis-trans isomerase